MKLGDEVTAVIKNAKRSVLIVAPFIRSEALSRLIGTVPTDVETTVVTRWRLLDLLSGASDLDVYDLAQKFGFSLYVRHDLHAKYFAVDDKCLVGSANVTLTALGWKDPANLELLTTVSRTTDQLREFEDLLMSGSVVVSAPQHRRLKVLLAKLKETSTVISEDKMIKELGSLPIDWIPKSRNPEELYSVYAGSPDVMQTALETMNEEIGTLSVISGLDEDGFREFVATSIIQTPLISRVMNQMESAGQVTETELQRILVEIGIDVSQHKPHDVLQILERWFSYFFQDRYETASDSVKLIKARIV